MSTVVLSIGANLGDRHAALQGVVDALATRAHPVVAGRVFETDPWGGIDQPDYLNAIVVAVAPAMAPRDWLAFAHACEQAAGRTREVRWGARTLDVDVVAVRDEQGRELTSDDPDLTLPHPRAAQRAFVLVPWRDLDPDATLAGERVDDLVAALPPDEVAGVRPTNSVLALPVRPRGQGPT